MDLDLDDLIVCYRDGLLNDTLPFWLDHCLDHEHGGYTTALDRDGTLLDTDKSVWVQGRFAWLLSTLCNEVEPRQEWRAAAKLGIDFLRQHCRDPEDGRYFFQVTRDGQPLRKRRYVFSEFFAIIAYAAYAKAADDDQAADDAIALFKQTLQLLATPGALPPKVNPEVRNAKGIAPLMIALATAQVCRQNLQDPWCDSIIDASIEEIRRDFLKPEYKALMETVAPDGSLIDHIDGRCLNPGHAIECAWFILAEAKHRGGDKDLIELGTTILDWMWDWGWDAEYGGIIYYRDVLGKPAQEYWQDMKFWWPQNEVIIALLLAYQLTGEEIYSVRHARANDWAHRYLADPEYGEWYGYAARDGRVTNQAKGNMWKGPFHLPRMQLLGWQICEELNANRKPTSLKQ